MDATAPAVIAAVPALNTDRTARWFTGPRHIRRHAGKLSDYASLRPIRSPRDSPLRARLAGLADVRGRSPGPDRVPERDPERLPPDLQFPARRPRPDWFRPDRVGPGLREPGLFAPSPATGPRPAPGDRHH